MRTRALAALALCVAGAARAQGPARVQVQAVPEFTSVAPGSAFRVAVRLRIPEGCHISWINPGQSGLPTTLAWQTPSGVDAGEPEWPYPVRDETAGFVSHVYRGAVVVVTRFQVYSSVRSDAAVLRAALSWGVCGATCVPQKDTVEISLPIRRGRGETTAEWRALAPSLEDLPLDATSLEVRAAAQGDSVRLMIAGPSLDPRIGGKVTFFPRPSGAAVAVPVRRAAHGVTVTLPSRALRALPGGVAGILVADEPWLSGSLRRALTVEAAIP